MIELVVAASARSIVVAVAEKSAAADCYLIEHILVEMAAAWEADYCRPHVEAG